jgi:hypothetical protein
MGGFGSGKGAGASSSSGGKGSAKKGVPKGGGKKGGSGVTLPHGPQGHPQWAVAADEVLQLNVPFRVVSFPGPVGWFAGWKERALARGLAGFSIRAARQSQYKHDDEALKRGKQVLTLTGPRPIAEGLLQEFMAELHELQVAELADEIDEITAEEPSHGGGEPEERQETHRHGHLPRK